MPDTHRITPALAHMAVPIDSLRTDPANLRKHPERSIAAIAESLRRFGQQKPIVFDSAGVLIAGSGTLQAARQLGWTHVAAVKSNLTGEERTLFAIADNRTPELSAWDINALDGVLKELSEEDLASVGFTTAELSGLQECMSPPPNPGLVSPDDVPEPPPVADSRPGDLWLLGEHRLLCGDSTNPAHVDRLMNGAKAAIVATDPPYLVDYTGDRPNDTGKDWSATYREVEITDADGFFRGLFSNVLRVVAPKAAIYCWHAHKRQALISRVWSELGILDHQQIIWVKPSPVFGRVYWHFRHEPCMMGWVQGSQPEHDSDHTFNSVWEIDWEGKSRIVGNEHPTQKPVEIFARPIRKHTKPGDVCFEPFSGSGSQLIAAEQSGRRCYAMEIQPVFVDAAVRRWETFTGKKAVLERDGQSVLMSPGAAKQRKKPGRSKAAAAK